MDVGLDHQVENAANLCARLEKPPDPVNLDSVDALEYTAVRLVVRERVHKIHIEDHVWRRATRETHCVFRESTDGVEECGVWTTKSFHARQIELARNAFFLQHRVVRPVKPVKAFGATGVADNARHTTRHSWEGQDSHRLVRGPLATVRIPARRPRAT